MTPAWFKKEPSPEKIAVERATETLERVRKERKSLLAQVIQKIDEIPLDERLIDLGRDLRGKN